MHQKIITGVDEELVSISQKLEKKNFTEIQKGHDKDEEKRIVYLFWDQKNQLMGSYPPNIKYSSKLINKITPETTQQKELCTIEIHEHTYRFTQVFPLNLSTLDGTKIKTIVLVFNIDPETEIMNNLLSLIVLGCILGLVISFFTGIFLANRSLIPIQLSWEKQTQFVADASHELRTPLSVLQMNLELLFRRPKHSIEEESETIYNSLHEVKRMNKLVADLLTLARSDSNQQLLHQQTFFIGELIEHVSQQITPISEMKQIALNTDIEKNISFTGDKDRIYQLCYILFDNALKYTPEKGEIHASCKKAGNTILLIFKDTGIGISEQDLPFIFDRFYRSDKSRTRSEGGTGLGLSIAKWIVQAHKGDISAASTLTKGTTITIKLPI